MVLHLNLVLIPLLRTHLRPHRTLLVAVLVLQVVQTVASLHLPRLNAEIIDRGVATGDRDVIVSTGVVMLGVTLVQVVATIAAVRAGAHAAMAMGRDLRAVVFDRVLSFSSREIGTFGAIAENIAYGRPDATSEEIVEAARAASVDTVVRSLPDGYDTVVDEDAGRISAGEKQLVTIARAYLARPQVLVLDEATSSVDTRTERLVQQAMARLRQDRTSLVIAHRLSTIRDADLILVMESGRVVEQGRHADLVAAGGAYAALHAAQFSGAASELA